MIEIKNIHGEVIYTSEGDSLKRAVFRDVDLSNADLRNAILTYAVLVRTKIDGADLRGADLRNARVAWVDFRKAIIDKTTKLPQEEEYIPAF